MFKLFRRKHQPSPETPVSYQPSPETPGKHEAPPGMHVSEAAQWAVNLAEVEGPVVLVFLDGETIVQPHADPAAVAAEAYNNAR